MRFRRRATAQTIEETAGHVAEASDAAMRAFVLISAVACLALVVACAALVTARRGRESA